MFFNNILEISGIVAGLLIGLAGVSALIGVAVSQYRKGSRDEKTDVVSSAEKLTQFWREQADGYKLMMEERDKENTEKINQLTREVGELRGQLNEKQTQYEKVEKILQGRNPEQDAFMKTMIASAELSKKFVVENTQNWNKNIEFQKQLNEALREIADFVRRINTHLEKQFITT